MSYFLNFIIHKSLLEPVIGHFHIENVNEKFAALFS